MGEIIIRKVKGMNWKAKIALVLMFALVFSTFLHQGLWKPRKADAAVTALQAFPNTPTITAAAQTASGSFTVSGGSNRLLLVAVEADSGATNAGSFTVSYGGQTLTQAVVSDVTQRRMSWLGYLKESQIAAASNTTLAVTASPLAATTPALRVYASTYAGVDQTTPINATYSIYDNNTTAVFSYSLAVNAGGYGVFAITANNATSPTITVDTGFTVTSVSAASPNTNYSICASKAYATAGNSNPTITYPANVRGGIAAATINPAPSGDSVNVGDGSDPANYNVARGSSNNVADSFSMVSTNTDNGLAAVTGVTASLTNSANISGVRLYKDNGTVGTYEAGTDTLLSTGTPGASVSFTGFTENLTTTATNYLIVADIASGATLSQTIDTVVTAVTVTAPDVQGTISDAINPTRLTIIDVPHEDVGTGLNTAIAVSPVLESKTGVLMQSFQVTSATSSAGAQDNQLELNSLGIVDLGTATGTRTAMVYIDDTSSATLPGTAVLIGSISSWTGGATSITIDQGTAGNRTVANATPRYIYIVYNLPAGATQTVQSRVTSLGAVSPDAGQTGLTLDSNAITLSSDPSKMTSCAGCHGYGATFNDGTARNSPTGQFQGSHNKHVAAYGKPCSTCHTAPATESGADFGHRNGTIQMANPINGDTGATYSKASSTPYSFAQTNAAFSGGTCSSTYCHSNGTSVISGTIPANTSATWGSTTVCNSCHGGTDGRPNYTNNSPKRNTHGDGAGYGTTHLATACPTCHTGVSGTAGSYSISDTTTHNNGAYDLQAALGYTQATGVCATASCHGGSVTWGAALGCVDCHAATQGTRANIVAEFGKAWGHKNSKRAAVTDGDCIVCHLEGKWSGTVGSSTVVKTGYHSGAPNGNIDLRDPDGAGETPIKNNSAAAFTFTKYAISYAAGSRTTTLGDTIPEVITVQFCMKCHDSGGATNPTARSNASATNAMPFGGIALGATYTATNGAIGTQGLIDVATQVGNTSTSRHPVGAPNSRAYPYSTRLVAPYNNIGTTRDGNVQTGGGTGTRVKADSVIMVCDDCHTVTTAADGTAVPALTNRTITAHGTNQVEIVRGTFMVTSPTLCLGCHGTSGTTGDTTTSQIDTTNGDHNAGSAFATGTTRVAAYIAQCQYCHFSAFTTPARPIPAQDIHGFRGMQTTGAGWASGTVAGMRPVAFMRNVANWASASPRPAVVLANGTTGQIAVAAGQSTCAGTGDLANTNCTGQAGKHLNYSPGGSY